MAFMLFFGILVLMMIVIGFYPGLKRHFFEGSFRENIKMTVLWLLSSVLGFYTFFQIRVAYQVLEHYEDFWKAMMIFENWLTGILLVFSFIFSFMIYSHYLQDTVKKFGIITSLQIIFYSVINYIRLTMIYFIHDRIEYRPLGFYTLVLIIGISLYIFIKRRTDYSAKKVYDDLYQ